MVMTWAFVITLALFGFALLALELFVIPGFGITGIAAIVAILGAVWFADAHLGNWEAVAVFAASLVGALALVSRITKGGSMARFRNPSVSPGKAWDNSNPATKHPDIGTRGVAVTPLRPAGVVQIGDRRYDVVVEGPVTEPGQAVEVTGSEGAILRVRAL